MNLESVEVEHDEHDESRIVESLGAINDKSTVALEDGVNHYFVKNKHSEGTTEYFTLPAEIDALGYRFELSSVYGMYELSFMTDDYGYAATNLSEEGMSTLETTLGKFVNAVFEKYPIRELYVRPAPESATVRDIEDCIEEILLKRDYHTREELLLKYKKDGWDRLFSEYYYLYGKKFERSSVTNDRTAARGRLLRAMLGRALPDWEIKVITPEKWVLKKLSSSSG